MIFSVWVGIYWLLNCISIVLDCLQRCISAAFVSYPAYRLVFFPALRISCDCLLSCIEAVTVSCTVYQLWLISEPHISCASCDWLLHWMSVVVFSFTEHHMWSSLDLHISCTIFCTANQLWLTLAQHISSDWLWQLMLFAIVSCTAYQLRLSPRLHILGEWLLLCISYDRLLRGMTISNSNVNEVTASIAVMTNEPT
jgi:hypothetical protein